MIIRDLCSKPNNFDVEPIYLEIGDVDVINHKYTLDKTKAIVNGANKAVAGTILVSMVRPTRGAIVVLEENIYVSNAFCQIYIKNEDIRKYVYQSLLQNKFLKYLTHRCEGGTYPTVKEDVILNYDLSFPKTKEKTMQAVSLLNYYDKLIADKTNELSIFKKSWKFLMQKMFPYKNMKQPEIRINGTESDWKSIQLGEIGSTFTGLSNVSKDDFGWGNSLYIPYMNIFSNPITDTSNLCKINITSKQNNVEYGDIFFTTSSETPDEVGMSSIWLLNSSQNIYLNSFCFGYRLNDIQSIDLIYLAYYLRAINFRKTMGILAQGISRYNISKRKVMEINIAYPDNKKEQESIGLIFKNLDNLIKLTSNQIITLRRLKNSISTKLLNSMEN